MTADLRLDLGDGRHIVSDLPPRHVAAAMLRMRAAFERGQQPAVADGLTVMAWLERQEHKHGGIRRETKRA